MKRLALASMIVLLPLNLFSQDTGVSGTNLEFFRPPVDAYGFFQVNSPRLMKMKEFHLGLNESLAYNHLLDASVGTTTLDIVHAITTTNFSAALGITDFLTLGLDLPAHFYAREANITSLNSFTTTALGDLELALKFRILKENETGLRPGMALLVTNEFPTGDENKFLGTSHMVPGVQMIIGKTFPKLSMMSLAANIGGRFPRHKTVLGINFQDQITYGTAMKVPIQFLDPQLSLLGEIVGHLEPNHVQIVTAPVEFRLGLQKDFKNGFSIKAGGGGAWNNAIGNPRMRGIVSLSFSPKRSSGANPNLKKTEDTQRRITTIYFRSGSTTPTQESMSWIFETARIAHGEKIRLEGHTDAKGSAAYNQGLSEKRAAAVQKILIRSGVPPSHITLKGWGKTKPLCSNKTKRGRRLNRRVEIFFFGDLRD